MEVAETANRDCDIIRFSADSDVSRATQVGGQTGEVLLCTYAIFNPIRAARLYI